MFTIKLSAGLFEDILKAVIRGKRIAAIRTLQRGCAGGLVMDLRSCQSVVDSIIAGTWEMSVYHAGSITLRVW